LRYLFDNLIDEEIRRDENFRRQLLETKHAEAATERQQRGPGPIHIPHPSLTSWLDTSSTPNSASTLKPLNGFHPLQTPGFSIGVATPISPPLPPLLPLNQTNPLSPTAESAEPGSARTSSEAHSNDYFTARPPSTTIPGGSNLPVLNIPSAGRTSEEHAPDPAQTVLATPLSPDSETSLQSPEKSGLFGKKFMRMNFMPKGLKKAQPTEPKTPVPEETSSDAGSSGSRPDERAQEGNFLSAVLRMRASYNDEFSRAKSLEKETPLLNMHSVLTGRSNSTPVTSTITPSLPNDTPVLKPPPQTIILIQEDRLDSGGVADLWEGTVGNVGREADTVERVAPTWLADVLLRNAIPPKDIVKVSFVLEPWQGLLPPVSSEGNTRLNANRMLRAKKILSYVAERIEPMPEVPDPDAPKAEEYLELYCQNQVRRILQVAITERNADECYSACIANDDAGGYQSSRLARRRRCFALLQGQWRQTHCGCAARCYGSTDDLNHEIGEYILFTSFTVFS
jgi:WD repeat-containing protein 48